MMQSTKLVKQDEIAPLQSLSDTQIRAELIPIEKEKELSAIQEYTVYLIVDKYKYVKSREEAIVTIKDPVKWEKFKIDLRQQSEVRDIALEREIQEKMKDTITRGSMTQTKEAAVASKIVSEKIHGVPSTKSPTFQVAGKNISIKTAFPFNPYRRVKNETL